VSCQAGNRVLHWLYAADLADGTFDVINRENLTERLA
jgi:hypothetical protein